MDAFENQIADGGKRQRYVVIDAHDPLHPNRVLLVRKDRPEWQAGCFNLVGGKVEPGEKELDTAIRELKEEAGLKVRKNLKDIKLMGAIVTTSSIVYCVSIRVNSQTKLSPRKGETEIVAWHEWDEAKTKAKLMPNLRCIIPMMRAKVSGWFLNSGPLSEAVYDVNVRFLLDAPVPYRQGG